MGPRPGARPPGASRRQSKLPCAPAARGGEFRWERGLPPGPASSLLICERGAVGAARRPFTLPVRCRPAAARLRRGSPHPSNGSRSLLIVRGRPCGRGRASEGHRAPAYVHTSSYMIRAHLPRSRGQRTEFATIVFARSAVRHPRRITPTWSAGQFSRWGPPTGIARERETRPNDPTPHANPTWSAGLRPASRGSAKPAAMTPSPASVSATPPFSCGRGERADAIMGVSPGGGRHRCAKRSERRVPPSRPDDAERGVPAERGAPQLGVLPAARLRRAVPAPTGRTGRRSAFPCQRVALRGGVRPRLAPSSELHFHAGGVCRRTRSWVLLPLGARPQPPGGPGCPIAGDANRISVVGGPSYLFLGADGLTRAPAGAL